MKSRIKSAMTKIIDVLIIAFAQFTALYFVTSENKFDVFNSTPIKLLLVSGIVIGWVVYLCVFVFMNTYKVIWKFAGLADYVRLGIEVVFSEMFCYVIHSLISNSVNTISQAGYTGKQYLAMHIISGMLSLFLLVLFRLAIKARRYGYFTLRKSTKTKTAMIIGAGQQAETLIHEIENNKEFRKETTPVCVIDDSPQKIGKLFCGLKVVGNRYSIEEKAKEYGVDTIIFCIPSCDTESKNEILELCAKTGCEIKTVPSLHQIIEKGTEGPVFKSIRKIEIEDLLGREPIKINLDKTLSYVENKVVLVTGGGGSIGSELCRQIAAHNPKILIIFDIYENNAYDIQMELVKKYPLLHIEALIGSVRDLDRLEYVFETYKPDLVYHAAAHKHVPLMEDSPNESIKNNVFGTLNTVQMSDKYGVKRFVLISTDKAVNPTNIMGASKRMCEMIVQSWNKFSKTEYVAVRFGNVLGSNGSVIPLFKKQIEAGGPVTVTHPDIIRYFMTIPEAVSLVLQAGAYAKGGEIFVLDMGKPVRIADLAENLIRLSGFEPYKDIDIKFTGLRSGEKLYEEMLMSEEGLQSTENNMIHIGKPIEMDEEHFFDVLHRLKHSMYDESQDIRLLVQEAVPTYIRTK